MWSVRLPRMSRTKPYSYTLFNLEGYAVLCEMASAETDPLWTYEGKNGSIRKAWDFMFPFIQNKAICIKPPDVQHFDELPIQSAGLLFAARACAAEDYLQLWQRLSPERKSEEVIRTYPLWQPVIWVE